jgi:hypothetical protein
VEKYDLKVEYCKYLLDTKNDFKRFVEEYLAKNLDWYTTTTAARYELILDLQTIFDEFNNIVDSDFFSAFDVNRDGNDLKITLWKSNEQLEQGGDPVRMILKVNGE